METGNHGNPPYPKKDYDKTYLDGPGTHMRHEHDIWIGNQAFVDLRFVLVYVEAARVHMARVKRGNERFFIHDCTAGGIDQNDPLLHLGEFGSGNDVTGVFLTGFNQHAFATPCYPKCRNIRGGFSLACHSEADQARPPPKKREKQNAYVEW
jgi:hypothetical protein